MAHKKAAWSAKNLRDSNPKYRGVKVFWGQNVIAWNIVVRQKWCKYEAWKNVYMGRDFSIHAKTDWVVVFSKAKKSKFNGRKYLKTFVNVVSAEEFAAKVSNVEEKKAPAKKATTKTAEKKPATKKAPAKKATTKTAEKKPATKKAPAKKAATKTAEKKPATKKAPAKKTTTKKEDK